MKTTPRVQRKNTLQVGSENRAALKSALHNQGTQWYLVESTRLPPGFFKSFVESLKILNTPKNEQRTGRKKTHAVCTEKNITICECDTMFICKHRKEAIVTRNVPQNSFEILGPDDAPKEKRVRLR